MYTWYVLMSRHHAGQTVSHDCMAGLSSMCARHLLSKSHGRSIPQFFLHCCTSWHRFLCSPTTATWIRSALRQPYIKKKQTPFRWKPHFHNWFEEWLFIFVFMAAASLYMHGDSCQEVFLNKLQWKTSSSVQAEVVECILNSSNQRTLHVWPFDHLVFSTCWTPSIASSWPIRTCAMARHHPWISNPHLPATSAKIGRHERFEK